ncbi:hypothetical protein GIB67_031688 [Kingdonia uniflora]|uniref:Uncharacterized protein n=1 Tax=Kingdonia uniflora TaxID=39325 RepID=A0A7J7NJY1_9MAGN|nr:hypothetical protein GIB67_031688 [Kingdonia uniflora]
MHKTNPGKGLSTTKDTGSGRDLSTTKVGGPLLHNSFPDLEPKYRGYPKTNGKGLDPRRFEPLVDNDDVPQSNESFKTICTDVPPSKEPNIPQSNVHLSNEPVLANISQSNEPFQTIPTNVHLSNEPCISQSNIHLSNEPVLTNDPPSNEPMLTNVHPSIEPEAIIEQIKTSAEYRFKPQPKKVKDLLDFRFKSVAYSEDPYDFNLCHKVARSALFRISTYCSMHTYIRVETEGGNAYKATSSRWVTSIIKQKLRNCPNYKPSRIIDDIQIYHNIDVTYNLAWHAEIRGSFEHAYQLLTSYFAEVWLVDPNFVFDIQTKSCKDKRFTRYEVACTNHVESWNNVILKVRDLPIYVFIVELDKIYSEMSYTYNEEAEKSQARLTPWDTDHCESRKFVEDSLTCRVCRLRHHFWMTSYGRTDSINIEVGTCS